MWSAGSCVIPVSPPKGTLFQYNAKSPAAMLRGFFIYSDWEAAEELPSTRVPSVSSASSTFLV